MCPEVAGIGVGVPSVVDSEEGIVYNVANIPSWTEVPLKRLLQERFSVPVYINNDSNCFALGVKLFGRTKIPEFGGYDYRYRCWDGNYYKW